MSPTGGAHARALSHGSPAGGDWYEQLELNLARQTITDDRLSTGPRQRELNREQNQSELDGLTVQLDQALGDEWFFTWVRGSTATPCAAPRQRITSGDQASEEVRPRFPDGSSMDSNAVYLAGSWAGASLSLNLGARYSWFDIRLHAGSGEAPVDL